MKKNRTLKIDISFLIILAFVFAAYCIYMPAHYGMDGWSVSYLYQWIDKLEFGRFDVIWREAVYGGFSAGRFTRGIIFLVVSLFGKSQWLMVWWVNLIGIMFISLSAYIAWKTIAEINNQISICTFGCVLLAFCQPFFTDWFQYSECQFYYPLGLFLAIWSARIAFLRKKNGIKRWICASVLLILGTGLYQITMQWFVWMSMAIVICYAVINRRLDACTIGRNIVSKIVFALSIYFPAAVIQLLFTKVLFHSTRASGADIPLAEKVSKVLTAQKQLWLMTPYTGNNASSLFVIVCFVIFLMSLYSIYKWDINRKEKIVMIAIMLICTFGFYVSIFLPIFLTESWYAQRCMVGFWGIPLLFSLTLKKESIGGQKAILPMIPLTFTVCMILINIYTCIRFGSDLYQVNAMDAMRAQLIEEEIQNYELESGIQIERLAFHYDSSPMYGYPDIFFSNENNASAWSSHWNPLAIVNVTNNKDYKECEYDEKLYVEKYGDVNWDVYSSEQIFFAGDTGYVVVY